MHSHHRVPGLPGVGEERSRAEDSGHVDQDVHPAEAHFEVGEGRADLARVGHVAGHGLRRPTLAGQAAHGLRAGPGAARPPLSCTPLSTITTWYPPPASALAMANPMPRAPPVTTAT